MQIDNFYGIGNANELLVLSDSEPPITDSQCRKLISEPTVGSFGLWSRYYFETVPKEGQWYKNFVFFKVTKPCNFFRYYEESKALYDVVNKHYFTYSKVVDSKQYAFLHKDYLPDENAEAFCYFSIHDKRWFQLKIYDTVLKKKFTICTKYYDDGKNYIDLKPVDSPDLNPLKTYCLTNVDFINEDVPDYSVNLNAEYLLLQRDYKLGGKFNTVIFPVDVPIYDYHHVYNNGKNRMIVYRLEAMDSNSLNFVRDISGVLKANTPYIIKSEKNDNTTPEEIFSEYYLSETPVDHFEINRTMKVMSANDIDVYAQYKKSVVQKDSTISPNEDIYVVSNNKLVNCRNIETTRVNRFRWYIKRPRTASATPMTMIFDGVTEVESVENETPKSDYIYDLSGVVRGKTDKINSLRKGYYVVNGKVRLIGD